MGVLERVNKSAALVGTTRAKVQSRDAGMDPLSLDDWAAFFTYAGLGYPLIQTTMGGVDRERIPVTSIVAMETNTAVFSLVAARVQAFSQVRFQWTRFQGAVPGDLFYSKELDVIEHPWPNGDTMGLLARMEIDNSIAGNAYIVRPRKDRLARLRPDRVSIVLGSQMNEDVPTDAPDIEVAGYYYLPRNGRGIIFLPDEIAHYAPMPDPVFQFLGMSWMTPAIREIQGDSLAVEHKARFFENAATPNLAIKFDPSIPIDMVKQFKALMENEHKGALNAYKTLYLGGGADPVTVGKDFQQLDFAVTQGKGESRLAAAAGVPASWVGFSEGLAGSSLNAGNFNSQRRRFSDGTLWHLWTCAANALGSVIAPPPGATLWFDTRGIPILREDAGDVATIQQQEATTITTLVREGFTPESVIAAVENNDWTLLRHSGYLSVQLQPSGPGQPMPPAPVSVPAGNGKTPVNGSNGSANGKKPAGKAPTTAALNPAGKPQIKPKPATQPPLPNWAQDIPKSGAV